MHTRSSRHTGLLRPSWLRSALVLALALPSLLFGQGYTAHETTAAAAVASAVRLYGPRPAVGERASYEVRLAGRAVGTGSLAVLGEEEIHGVRALRTSLQVKGGVLFAKVDDRFDSWIDPSGLFSHRFVQNQKELTSTRQRDYDFAIPSRTWREKGSGETAPLASDQPLDDVSFLFHVRTLPLRVGDVDTIPRYFKEGRDVIVRVLRRERVTVPAGTFETIVVQPTITNVGGLFGQGGQAEVYFSDDASRTLVMLKSRVPVLGSLSLHLTESRSGR